MKSKIYATGNETLKGEFNISYYIFEKDKIFLNWLAKLLIEVFEIKDGKQEAKFIIKKEKDEKGNFIGEKAYLKEINKMVDLHEKYENKGERVDVFYGQERVYVTLRNSKEMRKKFAEFVKKTKVWVKVNPLQERPIFKKKIN